jgi:hypothetical protein
MVGSGLSVVAFALRGCELVIEHHVRSGKLLICFEHGSSAEKIWRCHLIAEKEIPV